ncbi:UNVERIFIED_CONTAM: hypothetical protein FKN15_015780 [Acipenser sinensis]
MLDASALDAWCIDASTLGARTSTLDALARRRLDARCMYLDTRCMYLDARCTHLDARCFGARHSSRRCLNARCTHLDARRSVHAPRRSTLRRSTLGALTLGARRTFDVR